MKGPREKFIFCRFYQNALIIAHVLHFFINIISLEMRALLLNKKSTFSLYFLKLTFAANSFLVEFS